MKLVLHKGLLKVLANSMGGSGFVGEFKMEDATTGWTETGCTGTECGITYMEECGTATLHGSCQDCTNAGCPTIGPDGDPEC